jgi:chromate transporter
MSDPGAAYAAGDAPRPSLWRLARAFNQIALESFGGGMSAWSREVIVLERGWMTDEEFLSASTICRILPGANQVNMAVFVGTKLHGVAGALAAVAGLVLVPAVLLLVLAALYVRFRDVAALKHALSGMAAAAAGLTFSVAWQQGRKVVRSAVPVVLCAGALLLSAGLRTPLWLVLLLLGPAGFAWAWRRAAA